MAATPREPDWRRWLESWDRQQEGFQPNRERRFDAMLDVLEASLPARFTVLDLGSGPGSLTVRVLRRFPRARAVALDVDPVLLQIGRGALRDLRGRIAWVEADLRRPDWSERLPRGRLDAAVSTTALHWLGAANLRRVYRDLGRRIRPGGVFLDGDAMPWDAGRPRLRRLAKNVDRLRHRRQPHEDLWRAWWRRVERDPFLAPLFRERKAIFGGLHPHHEEVPLASHERALRAAGFREVAVVWQDGDDRVLLGIR